MRRISRACKGLRCKKSYSIGLRSLGATYFFTVALADRRLALLTDHIDALRAGFREIRLRHPFAIEAVVVLPDHLHAIWTLPEGDHEFSTRWSLIKANPLTIEPQPV